ncbi:MAG: glycosyltransferase family 2 protein [Clostridia bacterium]|nr:glycosyltransferase family 2 protein [Clostridia bacterium]
MKETKTLQIQAVLYKNATAALERSLFSLANAVRYARELGLLGDVRLLWGDASPSPVYTSEEIDALNSRLTEEFVLTPLTLEYRFFNENTGYGKGHNLLFADCEADVLMVLNPDIVVCHNFFEEMLAPFANPAVGLTEARQTPVEHPKHYNKKTGETPWASGACFLMPVELYRSLGGFDHESFFMYCEDVDLSFRIRQAGKKLIYRPSAPVYHGKRFDDRTGELEHTYTELRYSVESQIILAHKWNQKRMLSYLISVCRNGDENQRAALAAYEKRVAEGTLSCVSGSTHVFKQSHLKNRYTM